MSIEEDIAQQKNYIALVETDIEFADKEIQITKGTLKKSIPSVYVNKFIEIETKLGDYFGTSEDERASLGETATKLVNEYPSLYDLVSPCQNKGAAQAQLEDAKAQLKKLEADKKKIQKQTKQQEKAEKAKEESQKKGGGSFDGHIYPIKLVTGWTDKLKMYNKMMDEFIEKIDNTDVDIDITWLCKKIEKFCRKINYYIALVRYEIVKGLSKMYKQANKFADIIDPIVNFNPADIFACLGWVKNVIKFFFGPYEKIITFIQDFMTYTPPLVSEAATLLGKTASVPAHLLGTINLVAEGKDGEKKEIAEVYKEYIQIKMEPITMGDIMGNEPEKPTMATANITAKQKEIYQKKKDTAKTELDTIWGNLNNYVNQTATGAGLWVAFPQKINQLSRKIKYYSKSPNSITSNPQGLTADTVARIVFGQKNYLLKDYYSMRFSSTMNEYYEMWDVDMFRSNISGKGILYTAAYNYYYNTYSDNKSKSVQKIIKKNQILLDYIKSYSAVFPEIPQYLDQFGAKVKESMEIIKKMEDLDNPSAFD